MENQIQNNEKTIVISAINFFEGGPLTILMDLIDELCSDKYSLFKIVIFVHKKDILFKKDYPTNITFIELPKSRRSYLYRLYYEYIYFYNFSHKNKVFLWLSLHDITPNVVAKRRVVYCHNPTPFYEKTLKDLFLYPNLFLSSAFYKYLYRINIHKNDYVIVQPLWIKNEFIKLFNIKSEKIIVATPVPITSKNKMSFCSSEINNDTIMFFYPCIPRPFKNIEVVAEACKILSEKKVNNFKLILTIDGSENKYSRIIYERFKDVKELQFMGRQTRESVNSIYKISNILLFPSTLETWGLPLTEFKPFGKPIFVSDLPYSKETIGEYENVRFLDPKNPNEWAEMMKQVILKLPIEYQGNKAIEIPQPKADSWLSIFKLLIA